MPRWLLFSLATIVLWGVWGFLGKLADGVPVNPLVVQALMTIGLVPAALIAAMSPAARSGRKPARGAAIAFLTGLIACLANTATYKAFTEGGPASIVLPVAAVYPILTVLVAWGFMGEKVNLVQMLGIFIGVAGVAVLGITAGGGTTADGILDALRHAAGERWMFSTIVAMLGQAAAGVTQKLSTDDLSPEGSFVAFACAFVPVALVIVIASAAKYHLPWTIGARGWTICLAIGLATGFGVLASFAAYRHGKAAVVTPMTGLYPVVTTLLAVPLLHEHFGVMPLIGTVLALGGAAAMSYEKRRADPEMGALPEAAVDTAEAAAVPEASGPAH